MMSSKFSDFEKVTQVFPEKKQMLLSGLYLRQRLAEISAKIGRSLVITDFLTDRNGVIAKTDLQHHFRVPVELKNTSDWRLFQELMAQADVIISGSSYLRRASGNNSNAQNILSQFEQGGGFEKLGEWRLGAGYKKRSPDLAIVTHSLDFPIPDDSTRSDRKITILTTNAMANSSSARTLSTLGMFVIGCGKTGVDGNRMIDWLSNEMGYRVIMMAAGPGVLNLLLVAKRLDLIYLTEVQREIPWDIPSTVQTVLSGGKKVNELKEFRMAHQFIQEDVVAEDGSPISQFFLRYDRKGMLVDRCLNAPAIANEIQYR